MISHSVLHRYVTGTSQLVFSKSKTVFFDDILRHFHDLNSCFTNKIGYPTFQHSRNICNLLCCMLMRRFQTCLQLVMWPCKHVLNGHLKFFFHHFKTKSITDRLEDKKNFLKWFLDWFSCEIMVKSNIFTLKNLQKVEQENSLIVSTMGNRYWF